MSFLKVTGAVVLAASLSLSSVAFAASGVAELVNVSGKVLVQQGEGFVPVTGTVMLLPGDKVMVGAESSATISYLDGGCSVSINDQSLVKVAKKAPCGKGETAAIAGGDLIVPAQAAGGSNTAAYGVAAAFVVVGGLAVLLSDDRVSGN
jgi:hypothetical protein